MPVRKNISKKLRFEIFKRDNFSCVYCGAHPPAVILHIDHLVAVANGGDNDPSNLVTACKDCNQGKGARPIDRAPQPLADRASEIREREDQLAAYRMILQQKKNRKEADLREVVSVFEQSNPGYTMSDSAQRSVVRFLDNLAADEIIHALDITHAADCRDQFRYFCGVCWKKIRGERLD